MKRLKGTIVNLQNAMGLENNNSVYMNCHVSLFSFTINHLSLYVRLIRQLLVMLWHVVGCRMISIGKNKIPPS